MTKPISMWCIRGEGKLQPHTISEFDTDAIHKAVMRTGMDKTNQFEVWQSLQSSGWACVRVEVREVE